MRLAELMESPRLWNRTGGRRRVTWMELFFDLIFVAAVAQVGKPLAEDYSPAGLLRYSFSVRADLVGVERPHSVCDAVPGR